MGNRRSREFRKREQDLAAWERVRTQPRDLVEDVIVPAIGIRKVQLVFAPSLEPGFGWDICVLGSAWRLFRSEVSDPTAGEVVRLTGYEELDADEATLKAYSERLLALQLPLGPLGDELGGCDGTNYHLALFGGLQTESRFRWWSDYPAQWAPLVEIADDMIASFLRIRVL